jgi:hypothetical protein
VLIEFDLFSWTFGKVEFDLSSWTLWESTNQIRCAKTEVNVAIAYTGANVVKRTADRPHFANIAHIYGAPVAIKEHCPMLRCFG